MMKKIRVAVNGFGRIGRLAVRAALVSGRKDIEFVAINDLSSAQQNAFLLKYDSVHGTLPMDVKLKDDTIVVGDQKIKCLSERDPLKLPWGKMKIDVVMECTGVFTHADAARAHLKSGAKRVLISAPSPDADATVVFGVNQKTLTARDFIVSNASCTTNCLAPIAQVLNNKFEIVSGWMTTVHAYTCDQQLLDKHHKDFRRARAAGMSIVPTSSGATRAIDRVLPDIAGRLGGVAIRVPVPDVSLIELTVNTKKRATVATVNSAMFAAKSRILGYSDLPLVSVDFTNDPHSAIFDASQTQILGDRIVHVAAWYDNEWGFANRMDDVAVYMGKFIKN